MPEMDGAPEIAEFSGSYGIVIKPDAKTREKAEALAREMAPDAEFQVTVPHITLYHGRVESLPLKTVKDILLDLAKHEHESLSLNSFEIYGGKLLFWDVEKNDILRSMHEQALKISTFLDKDAVARSTEEALNLTPDELENIKGFGHPLVMDRFTPHITLAYDSRGLALPQSMPEGPWNMQVDEVVFTEIGKYGSVTRVVELQ